MSNQPIIFNIEYTPYSLPKNATAEEKAKHKEARAFFDMSGTKNIYRYITQKKKCLGEGKSVLEYFQKNSGVFNGRGILSQAEVAAMKKRILDGEKNIWHGYISLSEEESHKIDTPEKCIALIRSTFNAFLKDMKFNPDNIDLMCALHKDRPHHLHIHFQFWEKSPKYKGKDGRLEYRRRGKVEKSAIDAMFVRLGLAISDRRDSLYKNRDAAIQELYRAANAKNSMQGSKRLKEEILSLAKALPKTGRIAYASKDMAPYRARADAIVKLLLDENPKARRADWRFYEALEERRREIENICGKPFIFSETNTPMNKLEAALPEYHNAIDSKSIKIAEDIEADYKRRQGNLVLKLAKFIKPEIYERRSGKKYKSNDTRMKMRLTISRRKVGKALDKFMRSFGDESESLEREFKSRLQEIEEEIARERKRENQSEQEKEENYKY